MSQSKVETTNSTAVPVDKKVDSGSESAAEESSGRSVSLEPQVSYYWVSSFPSGQSKLLFSPPCGCSENSPCEAFLKIFDSDGELINEVSLSFENNHLTVLEMEQYLEGCKLVQGFKQACVEVVASPEVVVASRFVSGEAATLAAPLFMLEREDSQFLPVSFSENRSSFVVLANLGDEEAEVRCRLYRDKRRPEEDVRIPPRGVRLVALEVDFMEHASAGQEQAAQVYLRVALRSGDRVGLQVLEQTQPSNRARYVATVS